MADSVRERIIQALVARLQQVEVANGYSFTVQAIDRDGNEFLSIDYPLITLWAGDEETVTGHGYAEPTMTVLIECFLPYAGVAYSATGEAVMADIKRVMQGEEYDGDDFDRAVVEVTREGGTIARPSEGRSAVAVEGRYKITYREITGSPEQSPED